jgi:hypothetical protein
MLFRRWSKGGSERAAIRRQARGQAAAICLPMPSIRASKDRKGDIRIVSYRIVWGIVCGDDAQNPTTT